MYTAEVRHVSIFGFDHPVWISKREYKSKRIAMVIAKVMAMVDDLFTPRINGWEEIGIYWRVVRRHE